MRRILFALLAAAGLTMTGCDKPKPGAADPADAANKEAARKNLRAISIAWATQAQSFGYFSAGKKSKAGAGLSWRVSILPYMNQSSLYVKFKLDEPWDSDANKALIDQMPAVFASTGKPAEPGMTYLRSFTGSNVVLPPNPKGQAPGDALGRRLDEFTDGIIATYIIAEAAEPIIWTKPDELVYDGGPGKPTPLPRMGGPFADGFHMVNGNGGVEWFPGGGQDDEIRALLTINGGEHTGREPNVPPPSNRGGPQSVQPPRGQK